MAPQGPTPNTHPAVSDPALDDLDPITIWGHVVEGFTRVNDDIQAHLGPIFDLPPAWFEVMLRLYRTPEQRLPMTQLANEVSFSSGGFTKLADRIEAAGYIERTACPSDRRVTWIHLNERGNSTMASVVTEHAQWLRENVIAAIGVENAQRLSEIMRTLRDR